MGDAPVDWTDQEAMETWLEGLPANALTILAARASLRTLPLVMALYHRTSTGIDGPEFVLASCRANLIAGAAGTWPDSETSEKIQSIAEAAASFTDSAVKKGQREITDSIVSDAISPALYSASSASQAACSAQSAISSIRFAAKSVIHSADATARPITLTAPSYRNAHRSPELYNCYSNDVSRLRLGVGGPESLFLQMLWSEGVMPQIIERAWNAFAVDPAPHWAFWVEWYRGMLEGRPMDWELQRRVALIPDADWAKGPAHIAEVIERIRLQFDTEKAAQDVEAYLSQPYSERAAVPNPMMGHNRPPADEVLPVAPSDLARLVAQLQTLQAQMQERRPDLDVVEAAAEEVVATERKVGAWLARKLDMSADEFFKQFGKSAGVLAAAGVGAAGLWLLGLLQQLAPLGQMLRRLLALLTG